MSEMIVVPLDGSTLAEIALPAAVTLAHATGRGLLLLGVAVPSTQGGGGSDAAGRDAVPGWPLDHADYAGYLAAVAARLQASGVPVAHTLREGDPATAILAEVAGNPALHAVTMATHGRSGLAHAVLGSVAERILHAATVPVLLVRAGLPAVAPAPYRRILVPLDGSSFAAQALATATALARCTGATLLVLSVLPPLQDLSFAEAGLRPYWSEQALIAAAERVTVELAETARQVQSAGLAVRPLVRHGRPAAEIVRCATEEAADLIVLATHGRSGWSQLWLGSVALEVVRAAMQPVLAVRPSYAAARGMTRADLVAAVR